ncbi:hypothetical protein MWN34_18965 [Ancylobacter sp. 6x-1]|uniref:Helix-turn-helix domain-containing protein n=1 Tax=Ancylobacter crimeensis TaxID=2579147 RepID=A0ABT0DGI2_9HYPH|nr:hypothetical protein [Ancylobacter crimeensis]MCK0198984.1 hypothetical protein [Ancylobacter crimeensis]
MSARRAIMTLDGIVQALRDRGIVVSRDTVRRFINRDLDPLPAGKLAFGRTSTFVIREELLDEWLDRQLARRPGDREAAHAEAL